MRNGIRSARGGFTLLDALVLALAGSLAVTVALPFLLQARRFDRSARCSRRMATVAQAAQVYRAQHDGRFPPAEVGGREAGRESGGLDAGDVPRGAGAVRVTAGGTWIQVLKPGLGIPFRTADEGSRGGPIDRLLRCPSDPYPYEGVGSAPDGTPDRYAASFGYNRHLGGVATRRIPHPGRTVLFCDSAWSLLHTVTQAEPGWYADAIEDHHRVFGMQFLFADGHAATLSRVDAAHFDR